MIERNRVRRSTTFESAAEKLANGLPLTVVFVNDTGFIAGAGTAMRRQVQSFLLAGHRVGVVCWLENPNCTSPTPVGAAIRGKWLGLHSQPHLDRHNGLSEAAVIDGVVKTVFRLDPDLVIFGNLHWAKWPLALMPAFNALDVPVIAYLHDCHWVTGRCAYPEECLHYLTGCDASCPTATIYPSLEAHQIAEAWSQRRGVFAGGASVPLAANSRWMQSLVGRGFQGRADVELVPLGVDHRLFAPINRRLARRLLGIPEVGFYAVFGATDISNTLKGTALFRQLGLRLDGASGLRLLAFGHNSEYLTGVMGLGNISDERVMPLVYSAANVMLSAARAEAFGQTLLEAAACGLPLIAIAAGGVVDIARDGQNAITLPMGATDDRFIGALETLRADPDLCERMGQQGRRIVEDHFTLETQYQHWRDYLIRMPERRRAAKQLELS